MLAKRSEPPSKGAAEAGALSARVYRILERMIVTLELEPGSVTAEADLIEIVGLGRTPVREAVQRLAWEGLMEVRPRAGLAVAALHAGDWLKVIDARRGVETVLARGAARNITPAQAERFRAAVLSMKQAVEGEDVNRFLEADKNMDDVLASAADNSFAARVAAPLQTHSRRFWYRFHGQGSLAEAADGHMAVVSAILAKDEGKAIAETDRLMTLLRRYAEAAMAR